MLLADSIDTGIEQELVFVIEPAKEFQESA